MATDAIAVVDCVEHVDMLDTAGKQYGVPIRTVIEVDLGNGVIESVTPDRISPPILAT